MVQIDMQKPDHCIRCPLLNDYDMCCLQDYEGQEEKWDWTWEQQMQNCPLKEVDSLNPRRKTMGDDCVIDTTTYGYSEGKWIRGKYTDDDKRYNDYSYKCNRCGRIVDYEERLCPCCGARMYKE